MIPVTVRSISISNVGFVVFLAEETDDNRALPIFIGVAEAQAIALHLNNVHPPRPMTHDLMTSILDLFNAELERVLIHSLQDGTFFAQLVLNCESVIKEVDARPSDAIALALRTGSSIYVDDKVMAEAAIDIGEAEQDKDAAADPAEDMPVDPLSELKSKLDAAIREERYEDAAMIRDEIKHHENRN